MESPHWGCCGCWVGSPITYLDKRFQISTGGSWAFVRLDWMSPQGPSSWKARAVPFPVLGFSQLKVPRTVLLLLASTVQAPVKGRERWNSQRPSPHFPSPCHGQAHSLDTLLCHIWIVLSSLRRHGWPQCLGMAKSPAELCLPRYACVRALMTVSGLDVPQRYREMLL